MLVDARNKIKTGIVGKMVSCGKTALRNFKNAVPEKAVYHDK